MATEVPLERVADRFGVETCVAAEILERLELKRCVDHRDRQTSFLWTESVELHGEVVGEVRAKR